MQFFRHRRRDPAARAATPRPAAGPPDERDAFAAGVREGRREKRETRVKRRGHPVLGLLVALVAVAGAAMLALAAHEGSFTGGGQVVDQHLTAAADQAQAAADQAKTASADAVTKTGQAIENAGAAIAPKSSGGSSQ